MGCYSLFEFVHGINGATSKGAVDMKTFGGEFSKQQKVSLSGRSKGVAETREEILERTRRERDARRQKRLEHGAALRIQAAWRSCWARIGWRDSCKRAWISRWGTSPGVHAEGVDECLRLAVMCVDPDCLEDVERFAYACEMYCNGLERRDGFWVKYVLQMSVRCLCAQRVALSPYMCQSWDSLQNGDEEDRMGRVAKKLIGCILVVLSVETNKGYGTNDILNPSLLRSCLNIDSQKSRIFYDIADIARMSSGIADSRSHVSSAESVLTSLLVYVLSGDHDTAFSWGVVQILLVDSLLDRYRSLEPLASKIWRRSMACFEEFDMREIVPQECIEPFLANLVQCLEFVMARGMKFVPKYTLISFMALVEGVLADKTHWNVSAAKFVYPLAEANVIIVLVNALEHDPTQYEGPEKRHVMVETVCRFVTRLLSYTDDSVIQTKITLTLAVKANLPNLLWNSYLRDFEVATLLSESFDAWMPPMILFCETCVASLNVLGDAGFYGKGIPLSPAQIYDAEMPQRGVLYLLKELLWKIVWKETTSFQKQEACSPELRTRFLKSGGKLLTLLHDKNGRRPFASQEAFYTNDLPKESFHAAAVAAIDRRDIEKMHSDLSGKGDDSDSENEPSGLNKIVEILQYAYPLVPFIERVRVFQSIVMSERLKIGNDESMSGILFGGMSRDRFVTVHRGHVLEDAFAELGVRRSDVDVKKRIRISFVNDFGENEAGIDGGGMFKEFLECIIKESTSPAMGLFQSTMDNKLYPSPIETGENANEKLRKMEFVGMMIGKALWEGILLELPLATFFLKKIRGTVSGVDDLPSLDPELAKHLSYLMENLSTVDELGLTFSITQASMGKVRDIELIPGGSSVPVTSANVAHFIHRTANFRLNEQIKSSCDAFLRGFHAIIPREWVASFNDSELQMLLGGAEGSSRLDLHDLRNHIAYTGGYDAHHPVIQRFWNVIESFSNDQLADLLRFVTSCPRPPILGFASLEPPLTIQMAGNDGNGEIERLPTAATCVNLLKLPPYGSEEALRTKLLYAIQAHAGFDLS